MQVYQIHAWYQRSEGAASPGTGVRDGVKHRVGAGN